MNNGRQINRSDELTLLFYTEFIESESQNALFWIYRLVVANSDHSQYWVSVLKRGGLTLQLSF